MATDEKTRSSYFTALELEVLKCADGEYEHSFGEKSNNTAPDLCEVSAPCHQKTHIQYVYINSPKQHKR